MFDYRPKLVAVLLARDGDGLDVGAIVHGHHSTQSVGGEFLHEGLSEAVKILRKQLLKFIRPGVGAAIGEFANGIHRRIGSLPAGHVLFRTPLANGVEIVEGKAEWINLGMTGGAGGVSGMGLELLANGGLGPVSWRWFQWLDVGRR